MSTRRQTRGRTKAMRPSGLTPSRRLLMVASLLSAVAMTAEGQATEASPAPAVSPAPTSPSPTPPAAGRVMDLPALVRAAHRNYPSLRAATHQIAAAEALLSEATVSPFFQLQVTGGATLAPEARGNPIFSPDPQLPLGNEWGPVLSVGVEGAIPIWTFGKLSAAREAAGAGVDAARHGRTRTLGQVTYDVRRAYYALQLALDTLQMISEGETKLERAVAQLEERIAADDPDASELDRFRLSSTIAEVHGRRSEAERLRDGAVWALRTLTGLTDVRVPDCPIAKVAYTPRALGEYQRLAREHRPELRMLDAGLVARRAAVDADVARYFPDLALALRAGHSYAPGITDQSNPFVVDAANYTSLGAAIVARWSLDLWGNYHRVDRREHDLYATEDQRDEASRGIALEVATTYHALADARRREEAWGRGHRDTRSWFIAAAQAYQVGTLEPKELVDAVRAYFTARFNHLSAIRDHNEAIARLSQATGRELVPLAGWTSGCGDGDGGG